LYSCTYSNAVGIEVPANGAERAGCVSNGELYIACLQLAVMTITGAGPGIIQPANMVENLAIVFLALVSGVLW
jgi:hypothetical protein